VPLLIDEPLLPGLMSAIRFDAAGRGAPLSIHDEASLVPPAEGFLWLHFNVADQRAEATLAEGRFAPPAFAQAVFSQDQHQRVAIEAPYVGGVIVEVTPESGGDPKRNLPIRLHFLIGPNLLVTGQRRAVRGLDLVLDAMRAGQAAISPMAVLDRIVGHIIDAMGRIAADLVTDLDEVEDHILDDDPRDDQRRLGPVRRRAVRLHRHLIGLRNVFHRIERHAEDDPHEVPPDAEGISAKLAQRLDSLDRDMVAIAQRARLLQEEISARVAGETNRQLYILSILTALLLPPTLITGFFGMNTRHLPFAESDYGSLLATALAVIAALVTYVAIRRLGILKGREE
jgi:magnesium transporter/zinc transporter